MEIKLKLLSVIRKIFFIRYDVIRLLNFQVLPEEGGVTVRISIRLEGVGDMLDIIVDVAIV